MVYLILVSLIWAFSFGLVGNTLAGLDLIFVATVRLLIATVCFLPFFKLDGLKAPDYARLLTCGGVQFGVMYVCYLSAFQFIPSHLVALFSITTPLYVVGIDSLFKKRFLTSFAPIALLSVIGALIIKSSSQYNGGSILIGFFLMQAAGLAFAFGQLYYRRWKRSHPKSADQSVFMLLYLGAFIVAMVAAPFLIDWSRTEPTSLQWLTLAYLGLVASGLGFFLWNKGATQVNTGALAALNNALVPVAMFVSLFIFGEVADATLLDLLRLVVGGTVIAFAVYRAQKIGRVT